MATRDSYLKKTVGGSFADKIQSSKVLLVGAGGIGCELLKNLVLVGVQSIDIIDLDTIDLSNLNRQFLFSHEHVKKSKAIVARQTALKFNPNVEITAHHGNIKDPEHNVAWFKQFDIVYNALDNLDARRHVNKLCLAAKVPLIESGTAGFNGQVQVIVGDKTECYDCTAKPTAKSFPVCTIRSTPSQPIHCIVWAKSYLFSQLFEGEEAMAGMEESQGDEENAEELENMQREANELKDLRNAILEDGFFEKLVGKIYQADIERLLTMDTMWKTRKAPAPLTYDAAELGALDGEKVFASEQKQWSVAESLVALRTSLERLQNRLRGGEKEISFDKDDEDTLDFVAAAANLRSHVFHIDIKSKFDVKQIAGNIIPAIATTNAIIAGVCVLQSMKVLNGKLDEAKFVFLSRQPKSVFVTEKLRPPNPHCVVSNVARATLKVKDLASFKLRTYVEEVLQNQLKYTDEIGIVTSNLIYDPDFDDNLDRSFEDLKIADSSFLTVIDEDDETNRVNFEVYVQHDASLDSDYQLVDAPEAFAQKPLPQTPEEQEDGEVEEVEDASVKRKREESDEVGNAKRARLEEEDTIVIDDDDDVIELD
ncbi:ubiquitin-activating enzyme E1-like [Trichomonascus vanleenenianus]|uniref:E1 ubiquitin-activating protein UBA2 n=1 Tax=Trichomonascus vanleenenianus TaxID=2268995 RepID=UPI003ECB29FB